MSYAKSGPFSRENVALALERIPRTDSRTLKFWIERSHEHYLPELVSACVRELELRGPTSLDAASAERHAEWADKTADLSLQQAIVFAFEQKGPNDEELVLLRAIAARPGISYPELVAVRGKRDVSLILGHFVYDRYGCFKPWISNANRISDVLFERDEAGESVRYRLTPEARSAFEKSGFV